MTYSPRRFAAGDAIRGFLSLAVFTLHAALAALVWTGHTELITPGAADMRLAYGELPGAILSTGVTAVPIFFVLSGYLVGRPFMTALVTDRERPRLGRYVANRVLRVVPAYWVVLIVAAIAAAAHGTSLSTLPSLAVFDVEANDPLSVWVGQAWTLEVEMKFYLALPLLFLVLAVALSQVRRQVRVVMLALLLGAGIAVVPLLDPIGPGLLRSFVDQLPYFGVGLSLAVVEPSLQPRAAGRRGLRIAATTATFSAIAVLLAGPLLAEWVGDLTVSEILRRLAIAAVVVGPLVAEWTGADRWTVLDNAAVRWLGTRSYSFYLVQLIWLNELGMAFLEIGEGYKVALLWLYPLGLAGSLISADLLYRTVERPYLRAKRRGVPAPGEGTGATPAQATP